MATETLSQISSLWDHDFDEADMWNNKEVPVSSSPPDEHGEFYKLAVLTGKKKSGKSIRSSLPMKVPDWPKILLGENGDDDDEGDVWFPPHVFLARQSRRRHDGTASFSVHEGIGRTLKGRDLSRVRDAIWKQTGFED